MINKICFFLSLILWLFFNSCSSNKELITNRQEEKINFKRDVEKAKLNIISGSLHDVKGDLASAILEYQEALTYDKDPGIYFLLARDYNGLGKYSQAVENVRQAISLDPDNNSYKELLGDIFFSAFEVDSAVKVYENIIRNDSVNIKVLYNLATIYKKNKPLTSIKLFKKLLDELGPRWDILLNLVEIYGYLDKSAEELNTLEDLITLDPGNTKLKQLVAEFYFKSGKIDKATEIFEDLLEQEPNNMEIAKALGELFSRNNKLDKALKIYLGLLNENKDNLEIKSLIAFTYARKGDWKNADNYFSDIISSDSLKLEFKLDVGSFCYAQGDSDKAVLKYAKKYFSSITRKYPDDPRSYLYLSAIAVKEDSTKSVEKNFNTYYQLEERFHITDKIPFYGTEVGRLYLTKDDFQNSIKYLERTKKFFDDDFLVYYFLGFAHSRLNENEQSLEYFEKALSLNPTPDLKVDIYGQLGLIYESMKNFQRSDSLYEDALKLDPNNHLILNNYSYSLSERGLQLERTEKMSKKALEKEPENSSYLDTYGWILYKMGNFQDAEKYIKKAVGLRDATGGNGAILNDHLGDVYFKLGNKEKALMFWNRSLEMKPDNPEVKEKIKRGGL